jgi:glycosyltransferase involved in cell wall biosynthesis
MRILYVTARWDPQDPDSGAGVNFNTFSALKLWTKDIDIAGPFEVDPTLVEKGITRVARFLTKKRLVKFYPSYVNQSNREVERKINEYQPDVIVSKASIPLVNVKLQIPLIYLCDSSVYWVKNEWPHFSKLGFWLMEKWEAKVINKASHIITFSQANADVLHKYYKKPENKITVHPIPSSLPQNMCNFTGKRLDPNQPIHLLLVGKTYHGKGVDIAIKACQLCNDNGIHAQLRIVGQDGPAGEHIQFMGLFAKKDPQQLQEYIDQYRWAHFLIFPSRFDAAGIVPSEAAGFGVPTITNNAGGLSTTVTDGVTGVVLKKHSSAEAYFKTIQHYMNHPSEYEDLCRTTYQHYQSTLNWDVFGHLIKDVITQTVQDHQHRSKNHQH